jgi:hypothetical protein
MENIESFIDGGRKLTDIFGYWPSFHDAEVIEVGLWRGDVEPEAGRYVFPILKVQLHVWELTEDTNSKGFLISRYHTLTTLRFHDINEFQMEGFNHQNAILGLSIARQDRSEGPTPVFAVHFNPAHGMGASFICSRVDVVDAVRCSDDGKLPT